MSELYIGLAALDTVGEVVKEVITLSDDVLGMI